MEHGVQGVRIVSDIGVPRVHSPTRTSYCVRGDSRSETKGG